MKAIEFTTKAKNGVIEIPKEYLEQLQDQFRVIILQEVPEVGKKAVHKKRTLSAAKIKTKGFKFNRDEANAR
jgi:hypothetical protein